MSADVKPKRTVQCPECRLEFDRTKVSSRHGPCLRGNKSDRRYEFKKAEMLQSVAGIGGQLHRFLRKVVDLLNGHVAASIMPGQDR